MPSPRLSSLILAPIVSVSLLASCAPAAPEGEGEVETFGAASSALTAQQRLAACDQDPRVIAGLVTREICAGADIFFRETFEGNGRSCGTCHPVGNNFTIDIPFIDALLVDNPLDPLFVFEQDPGLTDLETPELKTLGLIRENIDGFDDLDNKFSMRAVPHTLSLATSITPDPVDGITSPPVHRTGWSGDGAPGTGSLREFLTGAITQHYPTDLGREPGVAFRLPTEQELDLTLAYQMSLGRTNELNLAQVNLADPEANDGRQAFLDPARGRCNVCHSNAGANHLDTGRNRNLDTGTRKAPATGTIGAFDGGFGGSGLASPNIDVLDIGFLNGFGDGTFSTPPLIEAVDTPPFFHTNAFGNDIEGAVAFYVSNFFRDSPAGLELEARFGSPVQFPDTDIIKIGRFLRVLNAAFNLDLARQRLDAAQVLVQQFHDTRADVQRRLMELAEAEIDDALQVLAVGGTPLHPVSTDRLQLAKTEIAAGLSAATWSQRQGRISNAISRVQNARDQFGSNINFQLGKGNLMY
ncbi:hypothetical protein sce0178 [Sorangium cellulosum So ce56]|uniref:Cytochrome c domain-containing protein n=1 Tax=Sorangium cellulosum (strain So ce56) TaxID=448385 RepID=A9GLW2_SORC5|nr:hypothetical protein sce0178 [Sorangium cellulosum So ce56]